MFVETKQRCSMFKGLGISIAIVTFLMVGVPAILMQLV